MPARMPIILIFILTLILSIFSSSAYAYDFHNENVWIFKGAYELKPGERAELDEFSIKVHTVDTDSSQPSAILLVYVNKDFKESFYVDTTVNNECVYNDELKISIQEISGGIVSLEAYKQKYELVWITDIPKTSLGIGDSLEDGSYTVRLNDVTGEGATIAVKSEQGSSEDTYISGDYYKFSDEFMLHAIHINKNSMEVSLETLRQGKPEIKIDIQTDKSSYDSGEMIEYQLMLTNNGTIPLHGITLSTGSDEANVEEAKIQHASLEPAKMKNFIVPVFAPISPVEKNINIRSEVIGYDYKGNAYSGSGQIDVMVKPYLSVEKSIETVEKPTKDNEFGTDEYFRITVSLKNTAGFPVAVTVKDELDSSLIPYDLENTEWTVLVEAGSSKEITYLAKPTVPGDFTFKNTIVQWKDNGRTYTVESKPIGEVFRIHGSKVTVEKYLSPNYALPGEEIEVTINMVNIGDRKVDVVLSDDIRGEFTLISGKNSWEGALDAGKSKQISYTLVTEKTGQLRLTAATIYFADEMDKQGSSSSEEPVLYVDYETGSYYPEEYYEEAAYQKDTETYTQPPQDEKTELSRVEAAGFMMSSFIALFCMLAIVPITAYLYITIVYK